jgi:predicted esterase
MRKLIPILGLALAAGVPACGDDDSTTDTGREDGGGADADADAGADADADADAETGADADADGDGGGGVTCRGGAYALGEGLNEGFEVASRARSFQLLLPDQVETEDGPWPVVVLWHGYGQPIEEVVDLVSSLVSGEEFPFIAVLPESVPFGLTTDPMGFEWDMLLYDQPAGRGSEELTFYDELIACLDEAYGVDSERIHVMGFSAGGIMANMLAVGRAEEIASLVTYSGANFADETQELCMGPLCTIWPAYDTTNKFTVLWAWGGESDIYTIAGLMTVNFNDHANKSIAWYNGNGHDVVACDHGGGHVLPTDLGGPQFVEFFKDHPLGTHPTAYASDFPADYPGYCVVEPGD